MKPLTLLAALALLTTPATPARSRHVEIDTGSCRAVGDLLAAMRAGAPRDSVRMALERLVATPAYVTMFHHYNRSWRPHHLPPEVFERMILSLEFPDAYRTGENERADSMLVRWRAAYDDVRRYRRRVAALEAAHLTVLIDRGVAYAQTWLPRGWDIPDFTLVVQPQGGSPGYSIDDAQGYDFLQLPEDSTGALEVSWLVGTIAHESNHLGMHAHASRGEASPDSIGWELVALVVPEGVATEFISGAPAGLAPATPGVPFHIFTPALIAAWQARVAGEPEAFARLATLMDRAARGALTQSGLDEELSSYWLTGTIGRAYVVGCEMFAAIDLAFGHAGVDRAIADPRQLFQLYDRALRRRPDRLGRCVPMPDRAVREALALRAGR